MDKSNSNETTNISAAQVAVPVEEGKASKAGPNTVGPPRKQSWRERVGERLAERPFLRTLALNPISGSIALLLLGITVGLGLALPKIWRVTPQGFMPVVRCSLLDFAQAWSLARTGRQRMEAGDYQAAARSYLSATKNQPGDAELFRAMLRAFAKTEHASPERWAGPVSDSIQWLFHLAHTNQADVFLAVQAYDALDEYEPVLDLLRSREAELPPELYGTMAKASFETGDVEAFISWWKRAQKARRLDPELDLYHAAWQAGWGAVAEQGNALQKLRAAFDRLDQRQLAGRLLLRVYRQRDKVEPYQAALARLEGFGGDRLSDHIEYWLLLKRHGRAGEALRLAQAYPYPPRNIAETIALAQAFAALGDRSGASDLLERYQSVWGDGPPLAVLPFWALLGNFYVDAKDWDALIQMGRDLRNLPLAGSELNGFGWFVEGRGLAEQGKRAAAEQAFAAAVAAGFPTPQISLRIALILLRQGFPSPAYQLLAPLQRQLANDVQFWQALFEATYALRTDEALLFKAARRAMDLEPTDPVRQLNYAVALLVSRQRPEEAAKFSLKFLQRYPESVLGRLNHACALAMLRRSAEAERLLEAVPPSADPKMRTSRAMIELEISMNREDVPAAKAALRAIDEQFLFPSQRRWLAAARARLKRLELSAMAAVDQPRARASE